ncbi:MAG: DNA-3-methyladenine glycosylase [Acetobacteraceae bacterium]|nr:DNA-3-methyladenine glycosylase [Acetobacteraceae bacterium]
MTVALRPLARGELPEDTTELARFLIGKLLARDLADARLVGRIVETEAYLTGDAACHAYRRMTERNRSLFRERGHAYVYRSYGLFWMLNVSGGPEGVGTGVLIRAAEPLAGTEHMKQLRGTELIRDLARGPGRLAAAFAIDRGFDGADLCREGPLFLTADGHDVDGIGVSTRIGITRDAHLPLRFYAKRNRFVSGPTRLNA